jgi:hypothetical protein
MQQSADFIQSLQIFNSLFSGSEHWHNAHSFVTFPLFGSSFTTWLSNEKGYLNYSINLLDPSYIAYCYNVACKKSHTDRIKHR